MICKWENNQPVKAKIQAGMQGLMRKIEWLSIFGTGKL